MSRRGLRVGMLGCGLIGAKRANALAPQDHLLACCDLDEAAAAKLAQAHGCAVCATPEELLDLRPDVVVIATVHDQLAALAEQALAAGAHVLVEKPAGISTAQIDRLIDAQRAAGLLVKVGLNHRFHPAIARAAEEVHCGRHGELMHLRARYGHGGRPGYNREWRADPARSGGGDLIDQGVHLLDLSNWLAGPLPVHSALLRTQFWDSEVEDNAALLLGEGGVRTDPWAMLHVSWTEWKNLFSLEIFCRTAKIQVDGLVRVLRTPAAAPLSDETGARAATRSRRSPTQTRTARGKPNGSILPRCSSAPRTDRCSATCALSATPWRRSRPPTRSAAMPTCERWRR